jgi:eukaryotic-like serine/threonine-protein kinase
MMTPERWKQIKTVLGHALELEPARRPGYLEEASLGDASFRAEVERLLSAERQAGKEFLGDTDTHAAFDMPSLLVDSRIGQRVGPYEIVEPIGEGGMGTVYRAVRADKEYEKHVAIKLIQAGQDSSVVISRFKNERQILASLEHPNIARLLDGGTTDSGAPYVVMELIEGERIDVYCDRHRLPIRERLKSFLQVCAAVQFAHQRLIIHRDIKPGNILVGPDGVPKLLDFGIAKLLDPAAGVDATITMFQALTPSYASPEQIKGGPITTATDVYSLAVVLYELLTGHSPYRVSVRLPHRLAQAVCETDPERPSTAVMRTEMRDTGASPIEITPDSASAVRDGSPEKLRRSLRGDLDNIVLTALRKEPELRYATVEQFAEDIRRHLAHLPVIASKGTLSYRAGKFIARNKVAVLGTAAVALTLIGGIVVASREARIARQQAAIAQAERARAQRRFDDVHKLANSLIFEVHDSIENLPGATATRKLIMDRAVQYLDSLAKDAGGDSSLERDLGAAYKRIGQVQGDPWQGNVGNADAMLVSFAKSADLFDEVAKANPDSTADQLGAAAGHRLVASTARQISQRHRQLDLAFAISGHLMEKDPNNPKVIVERARETAILEGLQEREGDLNGALDSRRKELALREELVARNSDYPHARQDLAAAKIDAAETIAEVGSRNEALQLNADGTRLYESVVASEKNNARAARELAAAMSSRGEILLALGDFTEALANFRRMLARIEPMEKQDPQNVRLHLDVAEATEDVAKAEISTGQIKPGLATLEDAIPIMQNHLDADPSGVRMDLATTYAWKGDALARLGRFQRAAEVDRQAIAIMEAVIANSLTDQLKPCLLGAIYVRLGLVLASEGNVREAESAYRKAMELVEHSTEAKAANPANIRVLYILADADFGMGELSKKAAENSRADAAEQRRQWSQARDWYRKSEEVWRQIPHPAFLNPEGLQCGNPMRVISANAQAEAALRQLN